MRGGVSSVSIPTRRRPLGGGRRGSGDLTPAGGQERRSGRDRTTSVNESVHLGRVSGIRLAANWSLLPISLLIAWTLAVELLPSAAPGYTTWGYWLFGVLTAAAFYACLLAHELAHALVARRHGVEVKSIVLWLFGGVAQLQGDTPTARAELQVAAAGP